MSDRPFGSFLQQNIEEALPTVPLRTGNADKKDFLNQEFKTQTDAKTHVAEHPGDLIYRLFFSKKTRCTQGLCLTNPGLNVSSSLALLKVDSDTDEDYRSHMSESSSAYTEAKGFLKGQ
ncbi:hypothetical protein BGZ65_012906 [Modicella reniformis]|uniref:Uncharacterized protein n=1 Tax=Modicella reniformis TaxID=1440133 RepID=A0A9P6M1E9_9FUNG|nr:hypothetical protein BGZ65_012906 [Modicella reniformis]